jgi:hypothetical protein
VALSETMTAVSKVIAILTTPLAPVVFWGQVRESTDYPVPWDVLAGQHLLLPELGVPTGLGVLCCWPEIT